MESNRSTVNLTTGINETTAKHNLESCYVFTSAYFETGGSTVPYTINAILNSIIAIVATLANILVFSAFRKSTSLRLSSKLLIGNLVLTDLVVGLLLQPLFVVFLVAKAKGLAGIRCFAIVATGVIGITLACVSVMTMTAICLDRYIALFFHLRYREIVTTKRVCAILFMIWSFVGFYASTWVWSKLVQSSFIIVTMGIAFLVTSVAYIKIYRGLRHHHGHQVGAEQQTGNTLNVAQYRRSASSMMWIYCIFILCYSPFFCAKVVRQFVQHTVVIQCILEFSITIVGLNSCLNPFVYCLRLPEIRIAVLRTLRKVLHQSAPLQESSSRPSAHLPLQDLL